MIAKKERKIHEINAGSMADIAFLLLIFFLVTTTMEIDQGLAKLLPLKVDHPNIPPNNDRNVLAIKINSKDDLMVEQEQVSTEQLEEKVRHFYTANLKQETNEHMPLYEQITMSKCSKELEKIESGLKEDPTNQFLLSEQEKWQTRMSICTGLGSKSYSEMNRMAMVQLESQSGTTYKMYMLVINTIRKVVNELRQEKCAELWDKDYFALNENDPRDNAILEKLRIMIPERVIEKPIEH
ncbi:MAG: biopolymer transporter ExbD [Crocinitomicaceae bacterium]